MNTRKAKSLSHKPTITRKVTAAGQSSKTPKSSRRSKSTAQPDRSKVHSAPKSTTRSTREVSKLTTVLAMLRAPGGTTITAIMKATGWQQHSVRGFLTGVVKKKLELNLVSAVEGDQRIYRIAAATKQA